MTYRDDAQRIEDRGKISALGPEQSVSWVECVAVTCGQERAVIVRIRLSCQGADSGCRLASCSPRRGDLGDHGPGGAVIQMCRTVNLVTGWTLGGLAERG